MVVVMVRVDQDTLFDRMAERIPLVKNARKRRAGFDTFAQQIGHQRLFNPTYLNAMKRAKAALGCLSIKASR